MKRIIHISVSVFLSLLILVSGSGLIIGKMVCLKSGHEIISFNEAKDCCGDGPVKNTFKGQCCDIKNISFTQNNFVAQHNLTIKSATATAELLSLVLNIFNFQSKISQHEIFAYADPPLERTSSSSLSFTGIFRI